LAYNETPDHAIRIRESRLYRLMIGDIVTQFVFIGVVVRKMGLQFFTRHFNAFAESFCIGLAFKMGDNGIANGIPKTFGNDRVDTRIADNGELVIFVSQVKKYPVAFAGLVHFQETEDIGCPVEYLDLAIRFYVKAYLPGGVFFRPGDCAFNEGFLFFVKKSGWEN
jgi:hypothetical protein